MPRGIPMTVRTMALEAANRANQTEYLSGGKLASDAFLDQIREGRVTREMLVEASAAYQRATADWFCGAVRLELKDRRAYRRAKEASEAAMDLFAATQAFFALQGQKADDLSPPVSSIAPSAGQQLLA